MRATVTTALLFMALGLVILLWPHTYDAYAGGEPLSVSCGSVLNPDGVFAAVRECDDTLSTAGAWGWGLGVLGVALLVCAPAIAARRTPAPLPFLEPNAD